MPERPVLPESSASGRAAQIDAFLAAAGWGGARRRPLESDASFRHYTFLADGPRRALLMDAPPEREDVRPYLRIARHLTGLGLSAPHIYAEDAAAGLLVIEDLGEATYTRLLDRGAGPPSPCPSSSGSAAIAQMPAEPARGEGTLFFAPEHVTINRDAAPGSPLPSEGEGQGEGGPARDAGSAGNTLKDQLYALAVDVLIDLHRRPAAESIPPDLPPYDEAALLREALLFTDWYLPAAARRSTDEAVRDDYIAAWRAVVAPVLAASPTLVLRDYHVDNLLLLQGRSGITACGLLDFQDALAGHPAYDLVSLLEDARRDVGDGMAARMRARYTAAFPGQSSSAFAAAYAILGAQRHMKVLGIFVRLSRRDGKPRYLVHLPRLWRLLQRAVLHPALAPVASWLERNVPANLRGGIEHEVAAE